MSKSKSQPGDQISFTKREQMANDLLGGMTVEQRRSPIGGTHIRVNIEVCGAISKPNQPASKVIWTVFGRFMVYDGSGGVLRIYRTNGPTMLYWSYGELTRGGAYL